MEEQKEAKKKKILKLIKTIVFIILGGLLVIMLCGTCKKTKALSAYDNYNYQYIVRLQNKTNYNNDYYQINISMEYYYNNGEWTKGNNQDLEGYETYVQTVLSNEDGLSISQANFSVGYSYLIKGTYDNQNERYNIYSATTIGIYLNRLTTDTYNTAYETGQQETDTASIFEQGKQAGIDSVQQNYNNALNTMQGNYTHAINDKEAEIQYYKEIAEGRTTTWGSFKSLLGLIVTYPIQIFKEGLNVNLFGVNIGNFILGIGILLILFSILSFVFGGKLGGSKE